MTRGGLVGGRDDELRRAARIVIQVGGWVGLVGVGIGLALCRLAP